MLERGDDGDFGQAKEYFFSADERGCTRILFFCFEIADPNVSPQI
jgi:hypothetical protein